jgi:HEAT repeat protein
LRHADDRVRREVVRTLSGLTGLRASTLLRSALSDSSPAVRTAAAHALGHREDVDALPDLLECVRSPGFTGQTPGEAVGFLEALAGVADDRAVPDLVSLSRDRVLHPTPLDIRLGALHALAGIGTPTAAAALQKVRRSRNRTIRHEAERCLLEPGNLREPPPPPGD